MNPLRSLRKHAYSNILKISPPKTESFQIKKSDIFHISAQNIDCGYSLEPPRRGGSNEYPHSMFLSRNKKNNVYPCKPQFYYIKVRFKGVRIIEVCFRDVQRRTCAAEKRNIFQQSYFLRHRYNHSVVKLWCVLYYVVWRTKLGVILHLFVIWLNGPSTHFRSIWERSVITICEGRILKRFISV